MSLSLTQLQTHASKALQQAQGSDYVAYAWPGDWNGGDSLSIDGRAHPVHFCASPLEVREVLSLDSSGARILLVSVPENRLGQDVLGRLFRHRLLHVDRWQLVQDVYDVHQIDPRLFSLKWMPDMLLEVVPDARNSSATVLTYDEAVESCLKPVLGIGTERIDLENLLMACERAGQGWAGLDANPQALFRQHLVDQLGPLAAALLATLDNGSGHAAVGIGLVCEILYPSATTQNLELRDARVRLEQRLDGYRLKDRDGRRWADLAKRVVIQRTPLQCQQDFRLARELLDTIGASEFIGGSTVLPDALDRRLHELGGAVVRFLRSSDELPVVEAAVQQVLSHQLPPSDHPGPECAQMVVRLCRREAGFPKASATDLVEDYLANGAWEDWARRTLRGARPESLARAVTNLLDRVAAHRMAPDKAFAEALARTAAIGDVPSNVLPIESALDAIVAPLAQHNRLLMVVMDGMSQDVYIAIADALAKRGWNAWSRAKWPASLLATTPSITECSRASLFAGHLIKGTASTERKTFAEHTGLKRASRVNKPPLLLHKAALQQSHQLTADAVNAIADTDQRVVGLVINAIDDALAKSEQMRVDWTLESIPLLAEVLEQARRTDRTVVITSDHGHVLERKSTLRPDGGGERWRSTGRALEEGEITIAGPRVSALMNGPIVEPWSENIRYAVKKNGYHGGVSRQEMLVPFGIWTSGDQPQADDAEFHADFPVTPSWWLGGDEAPPLQPVMPKKHRASASRSSDNLFSMPAADDWLDQLMASPLLARQHERAGRMALSPERLWRLLGKLQAQKGRCSIEHLAAAISQPTMRMRGIISAMERMLNLDGFPIVTLEPGTGMVLLDIPLLKKQFLT